MLETIVSTGPASGGLRIALQIASVIVTMLLVWGLRQFYTSRYRARAAVRSRVVEVPRDFVIVDGCPGCGHAKAPFAVNVRKRTIGGTRGDHLAAFAQPFRFRYCLDCVRPIRRRRRLGALLFTGGAVMIAAWIAFIAAVGRWPSVEDAWREHVLDPLGGWAVLLFFGVIGLGLALSLLGASLADAGGGVSIVDTGTGTLFVELENARYRDAFARMNTAEGWTDRER